MLIGISGKMGSGKTTAAHLLTSVAPEFEIRPFAGSLKRIASMFLGDLDFSDPEVKFSMLGDEWGMTVRQFLQKLGTEAIRNGLHENAWVNMLLKDYSNQHWIVDDVRFPNEYNAIKSRGGIVIRIDRSNVQWSDHPSEVSLDSYLFDARLINNGTKEELFEKIKILWNKYRP